MDGNWLAGACGQGRRYPRPPVVYRIAADAVVVVAWQILLAIRARPR
jgi:hypothetical protein